MPPIHPAPARPAPGRRRLAVLLAFVLTTLLLVAPAVVRAVLAEDGGDQGRPPATAPGGQAPPATLPPG
jgi:hypothetical protein